jgi:cytochrome c oxidase subunit 2
MLRRNLYHSIFQGTLLSLGLFGLTGCQQAHSVLAPATPEAAGIARIWWVFFAVCAAVYVVIVLTVIGVGIKHRRSSERSPPAPLKIEGSSEHLTHRVLTWATAVTAVILIGLLTADLWVQRGIAPREDNPLTIRVTGHQWWWAAEYQNPNASDVFETANEPHVPIGRSIRLLLESNDVIHSFWVPELHGKRDLVPGHPASISFAVDKPGRFEGQCAEFCGYQHAHMAILVIAEEPAKFEAWAQAQRSEAPAPTTDSQRRGLDLFEHNTCAMCHSAQGTAAHSRVGPVLTHFASRQTLAAGATTNTREHLAAWILNPQDLKPGVLMPANPLSPADLNALLDYLEILK